MSPSVVGQGTDDLPPLTPENINLDTIVIQPLNGDRYGEETRTATALAEGMRVLGEIAHGYATAPALRDAVTFQVIVQGSEPQTDSFLVEFEGGSARVSGAQMAMVAMDGRVFVTLAGVDDKYMEQAYTGSASKGLASALAMMPAPDFVLRDASTPPEEAFSMMALREPKLAAFAPGSLLLVAPQGDVAVQYDPATHLLTSASLVFTPEGAPSVIRLWVQFQFTAQVLPSLPVPIQFDPANRARVATAEELAGQRAPLIVGAVAPTVDGELADGTTVSGTSLAGRWIVLDFWATWCGPCRKGLPMVGQFADWAKSQSLEVSIFGVNVWEEGGADEVTARVNAYWTKGGFPFPTMVRGDRMAESFSVQGVPTTILIAPDGKVAAIHMGAEPGLLESLKRAVSAAATAVPESIQPPSK